MPELGATATREVYREESGEAWVVLLTITHPDLSVPGDIIRVCDQGTDVDDDTGVEFVISNGEKFYAVGFEFELPTDQEGETPKAKIRIDNVGDIEMDDGTKVNVLHELRRLTSPPTLKVDVVLASTPNVVEFSLEELTLAHAGANVAIIEGDLAYEDTLNQRFPREDYSPRNAPGLFP